MTPTEKLNKIYELIREEHGGVFDEIRDVMALGKKRVAKRFEKPSIAEIEAYCKERGNGIDAESFYYFYESKGWVIGKSPMKSWKSAIITWEKNKRKNVNETEMAELRKIVRDKSKKIGRLV